MFHRVGVLSKLFLESITS